MKSYFSFGVTMTKLEQALQAAYLAGFMASGEGYNGEYPFQDKSKNPEDSKAWCRDRDNAILAILAEQDCEPVALKPCWYESKEKKMCCKCGQVHAEAIFDTRPQPAAPKEKS